MILPSVRVPAFLAHADLLVLPSLYEELGTILLEAMWVGILVVASRTGGSRTLSMTGSMVAEVENSLVAEAPFSTVRGGPDRAMIHLGE